MELEVGDYEWDWRRGKMKLGARAGLLEESVERSGERRL